jgi:apolipoprotein N-acyltransferase
VKATGQNDLVGEEPHVEPAPARRWRGPSQRSGYPGQRSSVRKSAVLAVLAGGCLAASLPPPGWWALGPAGAALLAVALSGQALPARALAGALAGLALFAPSLAWLAPFSAPGYAAAVLLEAGFLTAAAVAVPPGRGRLLALPAALVLSEAARGRWPFGGLPLAGPALGQASGPLAQAAAVAGALGLVALLAAGGAALAAIRDRRTALAALGVLTAVALTGVLGTALPRGQPTGSLAVAAVQGGGPRGVPGVEADFAAVLARHLAAGQRVRPPVDLVVWPEGVIDVDGPVAGTRADGALGGLARRLDATVVAGVTEGVGAERFRNAVLAWSQQGVRVARYDKVHRVPFGEYVPGRRLLAALADLSLLPRDAIPGRGPGLLHTPAGDLGVLISYEVFFADRAQTAARTGGRVLVVPTNASSYTTAQVPAQEVAAARLRAIETGRAVVQAAPTGYSALLGPTGRMVARSGLGGSSVLQGTVELRTGTTVYGRAGDGPVLALAGLALTLAWAGALRDRARVRRRAPCPAAQGRRTRTAARGGPPSAGSERSPTAPPSSAGDTGDRHNAVATRRGVR